MNRNDAAFSTNPTNLDISRSKFKRDCSVKFTGNVGQLIPFFVDEVLPGDTFNVKTSKVVRLQTPIYPIMDNMYLDTYYFYVPNRILWQHWRECMGANYADAWTPEVDYSVPIVRAPSGGFSHGTIADYFGVPTKVAGIEVSALPFRAYAMIWNEWFRDETLQDPCYCPLTDSAVTGSNGSNFVTDVYKGGQPAPVFKYHDYFTSCLPSPQRGPDVTIPIATGEYPVIPLNHEFDAANLLTPNQGYMARNVYEWDGGSRFPTFYTGSNHATIGFNIDGSDNTLGVQNHLGQTQSNVSSTPVLTNLFAINDGQALGASVNSLRLAFGLQRLYEKDARSGGGRYSEIIRAHFGVTSPDSRQQRPEYLGGNRLPININQVLQQSEDSAAERPLGSTGAMSLTTDSHGDFSKSFTEHGLVIGVCCIRYNHTYQQGLERLWSRRTRFDYYWPGLANIGEQAVLNKEIFAQGTSADNEVFGYQEAWAEYRYKPSRVAGEMRSDHSTSLDAWHLGDDYSALPSLSSSWKKEDKANVDRVLVVTSSVANQFFCDFYIQNETVRPMPLFSIPGLIDHH